MEKYLMQTVMGCIGAVGFAVLFNVRRDRLWIIAVASVLSWLSYAACILSGSGVFWAFFCGTSVAALLSELLARIVRVPVTLLLVPILIPLIPGSDLYHTMSCLIRGQEEAMLSNARQLLQSAGAIAMGIICASAAANILLGLKNKTRF